VLTWRALPQLLLLRLLLLSLLQWHGLVPPGRSAPVRVMAGIISGLLRQHIIGSSCCSNMVRLLLFRKKQHGKTPCLPAAQCANDLCYINVQQNLAGIASVLVVQHSAYCLLSFEGALNTQLAHGQHCHVGIRRISLRFDDPSAAACDLL